MTGNQTFLQMHFTESRKLLLHDVITHVSECLRHFYCMVYNQDDIYYVCETPSPPLDWDVILGHRVKVTRWSMLMSCESA